MKINVGDLNLNAEITGRDGAPFLLLSNSLGSDFTMWDPQMDVLRQHFRVVRYDTRGHGKSDVPDGPSTIDRLGSDTLAVMDHFKVDAAHLCGLSLGGGTVQWIAKNAPDRVKKLVIANSSSFFGPKANWADRIQAVGGLGFPGMTKAVMSRWLSEECRMRHPEILERLTAMFLENNAAGYISCCCALRDLDLRPGLADIKASTLVIGGTLDLATPMEDSLEMANGIQGAKLVKLHAGHLSNWEASAEFTKVLVDFLQS